MHKPGFIGLEPKKGEMKKQSRLLAEKKMFKNGKDAGPIGFFLLVNINNPDG